MAFRNELEFEQALANLLVSEKGWDEILKHPSEADLIKNWADILLINNKHPDRLNGVPLSKTEMNQILEQVEAMDTPAKKNEFINGLTLTIRRDNKADKLNYGKNVSLKIYDRKEIAAGDSHYQVALEPEFPKRKQVLKDRRGDMLLLINGMPVIHIELKQEGVDPVIAVNQIGTYLKEGIFTGIFSLVQIFVAMNPNEMLYFANPGEDWDGSRQYVFHWADFNNNIVGNWRAIAEQFLSIPMAHKLIGFYTIPDKGDGVLKVMRSYQIHATEKIMNEISKRDWKLKSPYGGHIWHTTGSGKTMTSFKAAEIAATKLDVDKVVFLMDRIELTNQSFEQYRNFAQYSSEVQETDSALDLLYKLKSDAITHKLIVTSIQKMSMLNEEHGFGKSDLDKIRRKKLVFIIDEVHRSTFGKMLYDIKKSFPYAMYFGFTGTPIQEENQKKGHTTASVIGDELHRYTIADGIRDANVLGFDLTSVATYSDSEIREKVALEKARADSVDEAVNDYRKANIFEKYMNKKEVPMARAADEEGVSIEENVSNAQYDNDQHRNVVVRDIIKRFPVLSRAGKFHAIFATNSIPEALKYFNIFEAKKDAGEHDLKTAVLVDPHDDFKNIETSSGYAFYKDEELGKMLTVYNETFDKSFTVTNFDRYKKDLTSRLAHRGPYIGIEKDKFKDKRIDIVIVVNQLLTGYDSKWVNTLYLDKVLEYENIIQAFSRTNRLNGSQKPFGNIIFYRKIHTMEENIKAAVKMYSGEAPYGLFVDKVYENVENINRVYKEIAELFKAAGISDFSTLPDSAVYCSKFASLFKDLDGYIESAMIQGFSFEQKIYENKDTGEKVELKLDEDTFKTLIQRYKELPTIPSSATEAPSYDLDYEIIEKHQAIIDYDYLNDNFTKYVKALDAGADPETIKNISNELHKSFARLPRIKQKYAEIILNDISAGDFKEIPGYDFIDYINAYQANIENKKIDDLAKNLGLDREKLDKLAHAGFTEGDDINVYGRFDDLMDSVDLKQARAYLEKVMGKKLKPFQVKIKVDKLLRAFILSEDLDLKEYIKNEL